jgi:hypothetical protein
MDHGTPPASVTVPGSTPTAHSRIAPQGFALALVWDTAEFLWQPALVFSMLEQQFQ